MRRTTIGLIVAVAAAIVLWEVVPRVSAQQRGPQVRRRGSASIDAALSDPAESQVERLREGVMMTNEFGTFKAMGDRIVFQRDGESLKLSVLENLALERVWKRLDDTRGRKWRVTGTVTEYRGRNFLLLHRAVLRARDGSETAKP